MDNKISVSLDLLAPVSVDVNLVCVESQRREAEERCVGLFVIANVLGCGPLSACAFFSVGLRSEVPLGKGFSSGLGGGGLGSVISF